MQQTNTNNTAGIRAAKKPEMGMGMEMVEDQL
jgi:hypothetical protein